MISGAFSQNNNAVRSQGQLGVACLKQEHLLQSLFFDTMFKYNGWASAAYMSRMTDNAITESVRSYKNASSFVGDGIDTQLSYVFLQIIK
jgi:hypothetical protein